MTDHPEPPVLSFRQVDGETALLDWQHVHNTIIPTDPLSPDDIRERSRRNHLEVAYLDGTAVGCSTVRPPTDEDPYPVVIARILPAHRRRGLGGQLHARGLLHAARYGSDTVDTIVLASNTEGVDFARSRGYVEVDSYLPPGDTVPFLTLRLTGPGTVRS